MSFPLKSKGLRKKKIRYTISFELTFILKCLSSIYGPLKNGLKKNPSFYKKELNLIEQLFES